MQEVHSLDYGAHAPLSAREQAARLQEGCDAGADTGPRRISALVWIVPSVVAWVAIGWLVWWLA